MMSGALSAAAGGPEVVAGEVFRSELNPVDFLVRAAFVYPEKVAVVDGGRRYCYRELAERSWRLASALRSHRHSGHPVSCPGQIAAALGPNWHNDQRRHAWPPLAARVPRRV